MILHQAGRPDWYRSVLQRACEHPVVRLVVSRCSTMLFQRPHQLFMKRKVTTRGHGLQVSYVLLHDAPADAECRRSKVDIHPPETAEFREPHPRAGEQKDQSPDLIRKFVQNRTDLRNRQNFGSFLSLSALPNTSPTTRTGDRICLDEFPTDGVIEERGHKVPDLHLRAICTINRSQPGFHLGSFYLSEHVVTPASAPSEGWLGN